MVYKTGVIAVVAVLLGTVSAGRVLAQVQRSGGGASAQLMQQYQQIAAERTQLQADNAKLKKDLDDLKKQLDTVKQQVSASKAGASRSEAALAAAQATAQAENANNAKAIAEWKSKMQDLVGRFRETIAQLRTAETERTDLQQQLTQSKSAFDTCAERNYALYQVTDEILDRYAHQGAFSYMARAEPFTRIKRTQIDNLALEYKERAEELRVKQPGSVKGPGATPAGGAGRPGAVASPASTAPTSTATAAPASTAPVSTAPTTTAPPGTAPTAPDKSAARD